LKDPDSVVDFYPKYQNLEYSAYLILQILNKVVEQHRYPFNVFINKHQVIQTVAKMSKLSSKLINIEIVKFYKAIMRSKMPTYVNLIVAKNLFYPIHHIFKATFHHKNPPMIQSVIRDLYEMIFTNYGKTVNEFFSAKLFDYLVNLNQESKDMISNPKYKDVFGKYERLNPKDEDDNENFLNQNNGSANESIPSSPNLKTIHYTTFSDEKEIQDKKGSEDPLAEKKKNHTIMFGDMNQKAKEYRRFQQFEQEQEDEDLKEKNDSEDNANTGNLSPIENRFHHDFGDGSNDYLKPLCDDMLEMRDENYLLYGNDQDNKNK